MHQIYKIQNFTILEPFTLRIEYDDGFVNIINFHRILKGKLFAALRDEVTFATVRLDPESRSLVWNNGADFDPETLRHWERYEKQFVQMTSRWAE